MTLHHPISAFLDGLAGWLPALLDSAVKGSAFLALLGGAALLARSASAAARHLIWLLGIVGLLVLPVLSILLPDWRVLPSWASFSQASTADLLPNAWPPSAWPPRVERSVGLEPARPAPAIPLATTPPDSPSILQTVLGPLRPAAGGGWLVGLWLAGAAILAARGIACFVWLRLATRRAEPVREGRMAESLAAAGRQLGIHRPVQLHLDRRRMVPLVWGLLRPQVILPEEARAWDAPRLHAVLLHELAHVQRQDLLVLCLTQVACATHWFNPLVWWAAWRLRVECERACDDLVLTAGVEAADYAEHLVHVAAQLEIGIPAGTLAMARPGRLEGRLLALLNDRLNRRAVPPWLGWAALTLGLCVVVPMAMLRAEAQGDSTDPASKPLPAVTVQIDQNGMLLLDGRSMPLHQLTNDLAQLRRANSNLAVTLRASVDLPFSTMARVLQAVDQTGVASITLGTQERNPAAPARVRPERAAASQQKLLRPGEDDQAPPPTALREARLASPQNLPDAHVAKAEMAVAQAELNIAKVSFNHLSELAPKRLVSQFELETGAAQMAKAEAQYRLAEERYKRAATLTEKAGVPATVASPKNDRLRELLTEEIQVAENEAALLDKQYKAGTSTLEGYLQANLDMLALKRQLAGLEGNTKRALELVLEQIRTLQELERQVQARRVQGAAREADVLKVRRLILSLQRQQAELE